MNPSQSNLRHCKPTDICVVLCAFPGNSNGLSWLSADEIRGRLTRLGFEGFTAQQVGSWLRRIEKLEAAPIESREAWGYRQYRATPCGETWVHNNLDDIWWAQQRATDRLKREMEVR